MQARRGENGTERIRTFDGVGFIVRGDLATILYAADARIERTRWLFDEMDAIFAAVPAGQALMVITADAGLPDAPTREENARRLAKIGERLQRLVTVPLGDTIRVNLVRAVMRAMLVVQGRSARHRIASTEMDGIRELLPGPDTPNAARVLSDLADLRAAVARRDRR